MRQLDHPNIIKLVDFSESRQYYYIILELAPGGELFHQMCASPTLAKNSRDTSSCKSQRLSNTSTRRKASYTGMYPRHIKPATSFVPLPYNCNLTIRPRVHRSG